MMEERNLEELRDELYAISEEMGEKVKQLVDRCCTDRDRVEYVKELLEVQRLGYLAWLRYLELA